MPPNRCFRCRQRGHRREDCTTKKSEFVPRCIRCSDFGHEESSCSSNAAVLVVELPVSKEDLAVEAQTFAVTEAGKYSGSAFAISGLVMADNHVSFPTKARHFGNSSLPLGRYIFLAQDLYLASPECSRLRKCCTVPPYFSRMPSHQSRGFSRPVIEMIAGLNSMISTTILYFPDLYSISTHPTLVAVTVTHAHQESLCLPFSPFSPFRF